MEGVGAAQLSPRLVPGTVGWSDLVPVVSLGVREQTPGLALRMLVSDPFREERAQAGADLISHVWTQTLSERFTPSRGQGWGGGAVSSRPAYPPPTLSVLGVRGTARGPVRAAGGCSAKPARTVASPCGAEGTATAPGREARLFPGLSLGTLSPNPESHLRHLVPSARGAGREGAPLLELAGGCLRPPLQGTFPTYTASARSCACCPCVRPRASPPPASLSGLPSGWEPAAKGAPGDRAEGAEGQHRRRLPDTGEGPPAAVRQVPAPRPRPLLGWASLLGCGDTGGAEDREAGTQLPFLPHRRRSSSCRARPARAGGPAPAAAPRPGPVRGGCTGDTPCRGGSWTGGF